jgi:chemotaxis protein CheD
MREYFLNQGEIFAHQLPHLVTTILGSCVSICLYDQRLQIGGMNHYMLPMWNGEGLASPKYGNIAFKKTLEQLDKLGSRRADLVAKVFGGGNVIGSAEKAYSYEIGSRNVDFALHVLDSEGIPVVAQKVNPTVGLKVRFDSYNGDVYVRPVTKTVRR